MNTVQFKYYHKKFEIKRVHLPETTRMLKISIILKFEKARKKVGRLASNRSDRSVDRKNWPAGHLSSFRIRALFLNTSNSISVAAYRLSVSVPLRFIPLTQPPVTYNIFLFGIIAASKQDWS